MGALLVVVMIVMGILLPIIFFFVEMNKKRSTAPTPWRFVLPVGLTIWALNTSHGVGEYKSHVYVRDMSSLLYGGSLSGFDKPWIVEIFGLDGASIVVMILFATCILLSALMLRQHHTAYNQVANTDAE
jgi:hypothetical protein